MIKPVILKIVKLSPERFEHEMLKARTMQEHTHSGGEYSMGYQRGLRRAFHGDKFGTPEEHKRWLAAVKSNDFYRRQLGQGYRDGLQGQDTEIRGI